MRFAANRQIRLAAWLLVCLATAALVWGRPVRAATTPSINFQSFTGIYHLSRDNHGLSLLTTEETIVADFPDAGFYGINRAIPTSYQNHSVNIRSLSVSDAAGSPVPYKTNSDNGNLIITTGDPAIKLLGSQTIKISYQTSGVINLGQGADEFLLNVNGRGWDQPFESVNASLYIPASFRATLKDQPSCYTAVGSSNANNCQLDIQKTDQTTVITAKARSLAAHQALVVKLDFAGATFTNQAPLSRRLLIPAVILLLVSFAVVSLGYLRHRH